MDPTDAARRRHLKSLALAALLPGAHGCASADVTLCGAGGAFGDARTPLTIDVHAHVFNGSDLQIREFLSRIALTDEHSELRPLTDALGSVLQRLAWTLAPTAAEEQRWLAGYHLIDAACASIERARSATATAFQDGYARGRRALQAAARQVSGARDGAAVLGPRRGLPGPGLGAAIDALPPTFEGFERALDDGPSVLGSQPHLWGYLQFVLHHFNFRHVNALSYLSAYSRGPARRIDLLVPSLVDYDWWLARGRATRSPLERQVDVMAGLSVLLGGRVHGFVAFCPLRELMTQSADGEGASMRLVRRAIGEQGFLGVKLYPPMGFAAWGNAALDVWKGKDFLPPAASEPAFGRRLDAAMQRLFDWCQAHDVPLMAHANESNGPDAQLRALARSEHWQRALERFPGLKVSFGHFGDTDVEDHGGARSTGYLGLMTAAPGSAGANVFADSGYFAGVISNPAAMAQVLAGLYAEAKDDVLAQRLMYGTDWSMILPQKNVQRYLDEFIGVMQRIEQGGPARRPRGLSDAFFGGNAVAFLGLARGRPARQRLEAFYARRGVPEPDWMKKVG